MNKGQTCETGLTDSGDEEFSPEIKKRKLQPDKRLRKYGSVHLTEMVNNPGTSMCRRPGRNSKTYVRCAKCQMFLVSPRKHSASSGIINDWIFVK